MPDSKYYVLGPRDVALALMDWHGGQASALYAVASSWYAGNSVDVDLVEFAADELETASEGTESLLVRYLRAISDTELTCEDDPSGSLLDAWRTDPYDTPRLTD